MKKVAIGGMIGAGKSTLVNELSERYNCVGCSEFRKDDELFNSLLTSLYEKKKGVEFAFQSYIIQHHHDTVLEVENKYPNQKYLFIDRFIIEHWLFAQTNLKHDKVLLNTYNCMFHSYMNNIVLPDMYIIIELDWETFVERIHQRGRKVEVDNFKENEDYFKELLDSYSEKLKAQCEIYEIPYAIIQAGNPKTVEIIDNLLDNAQFYQFLNSGLCL